MKPLVIINVVGLSPRLVEHAPTIRELGKPVPATGVTPAVTMSAQASMLTGKPVREHGVVGNTWYWRNLGEVRNWLQNSRMLPEPFYRDLQRKGAKVAKMFWWFNQGSGADFSATPKPHYGSDGSKEFDIQTNPPELAAAIERVHAAFPFASFWGPSAGLPSSDWIARASAMVINDHRPDLTMVYLPHLDYDLQRFGGDYDNATQAANADWCAKKVIDAARNIGAEVLVVSEYAIRNVSRAVHPNRILRNDGLLRVRRGPFGEMLDTFDSRAFAVCDHQIAHVYIHDRDDVDRTARLLDGVAGVGRVLDRDAQREFDLDHANSGDLVLFSEPDAWFAYPYWLDDDAAPDFARSVDIHRKPGYDPCELFLDPKLTAPMARAGGTLIRKKLGFRYRFRLTPLDASIVKGSHGLPAIDPMDGPVMVSSIEGALPDAPTLLDVPAIARRMMDA